MAKRGRLEDLPFSDMVVTSPIPAIIERLDDDNYVAEACGMNIGASGDTVEEAVDNLKDMVGALFGRFASLPASRLGVGPSRQLATLRQHIRMQRR